MNEDRFVIWRGQIVDDATWKDNLPATKWKSSDEIPGWGSRYRVRVVGKDTEGKDVPDGQLEMATIMYPVTAGSGHGGSYQTSNLRKGSFVWGFYEDPDLKQGLVILGCLGNNEQIMLSRTTSISGFDPFSGYIRENVPYNDIPAEGSPIPPNGPRPLEGSNNQLQTSIADQEQLKKGQQEIPLAVPSSCDKLQLGAIQIEIQKFLQDIQDFKNQVNSWKNTILRPISENGKSYSIEEYIAYKIQNVAEFISGKLKNLIAEIQGFVTRKINGAAKETYDILPPDLRASAKPAVETANDLLACLFRKIIKNLLGLVVKFLTQIAERFINAPLCAVENIVGALLGKLTGLISSGVQAIMAPLNAILGAVDIAGDIIGFVEDIISFLSCQDQPECPEVTGWSIWNGPTRFTLSSNPLSIVDKVKTYASTVQQSVDPENFDFDLDFSDIFEDTCNVGPIFCGPPTVEFYGGGGSGAAGNVIVNAVGDILAVDLTSFGSGYTSAPAVRFVDACGTGRGATGRAIIAPVAGIGTTATGVVQVIIDNNGSGYLQTPNGDRGGDGRVWAYADQTTVKRVDGTYDRPYYPGEIINVNPGDEVYSCGNNSVITQGQAYTAPQCSSISSQTLPKQDEYLTSLELEDVIIENSGVDYNCSVDKIKITPDHGAVLQYECDSYGSITKVKVINRGIGFTEAPTIEIETETGYNARFRPVFRVNRVGEIIDLNQVISVVDCVGKV